jgi:hypothetical protein
MRGRAAVHLLALPAERRRRQAERQAARRRAAGAQPRAVYEGAILWAGDIEGAAYGDLNAKHWEFVVLVRYPSRTAFLKMVTSPEYAQANVHRENGVDDHIILASTETYSKFSPPKA